jgi:hypothetical protein
MSYSQSRKQEKLQRFVCWVAAFNATTLTLWCGYERLVARGQHRFLARLIDQGFVRKTSFALSRDEVLLLTPKGKRLAMVHDVDHADVITSPSKIAASRIPHLFAVQRCVIAFHDRSQAFLSERQLGATHIKKRPDALIHYRGQLTALETEISPKYKQRMFWVFRHHIGMLKDKHYEHVLYCFDNPATRDFYRRLFATPQWPVIVYHRQHGHYRPKKSSSNDTLHFDPEAYRSAFSFRMMDDA